MEPPVLPAPLSESLVGPQRAYPTLVTICIVYVCIVYTRDHLPSDHGPLIENSIARLTDKNIGPQMEILASYTKHIGLQVKVSMTVATMTGYATE